MPATSLTAPSHDATLTPLNAMILHSAEILNFKNIEEARLDFSPKVNCVLGSNAMGKSNLLEAVHYLSFLRGFRTLPDADFIRHGADTMLLKGSYASDDDVACSLTVGMQRGKRKSVRADGKEYQRISRHIGRFPLVMVAPQDTSIILGSGQERRRFMDMVISQVDGAYLQHLMRYNRSLESRNRMLRSGIRDDLLFESVEQPLVEAASAIHSIRASWTNTITPIFNSYHRLLSADADDVKITYRSSLDNASMADLLKANRQRDAMLGYTSSGVHRDDLEASLGNHSLRGIGSQGQLKTFAVALKLAVFDFLRDAGGETPILLLDDIFDKLDAERVEHILQVVGPDSGFGQIFITDTNREHLDRILKGIQGHMLFNAEHGAFTPLSV